MDLGFLRRQLDKIDEEAKDAKRDNDSGNGVLRRKEE